MNFDETKSVGVFLRHKRMVDWVMKPRLFASAGGLESCSPPRRYTSKRKWMEVETSDK